MGTVTHGAAVLGAAASLAAGLSACGNFGEPEEEPHDGGGIEVGLLLPDNLGRWESSDRPLIEHRVDLLCGRCPVAVANAQGDVATQQRQVDSMITQGVDVLILTPIDAEAIRSSVERAERAGVPVVAYDRLADGPVSGFASFDNVLVGEMQGRALLRALGDRASGAQTIMLNGSPTDPNAALFERGARSVLDGRVDIAASYDTPGWTREGAYTDMAGAIVDVGAEEIDAVYAANDSLAAGAISALKAAHIGSLPPVTGQDAELSAIQLILAGEQYMTVYKPFALEAGAAAEMAVALARGQPLDGIADATVSNDTAGSIPAVLATPLPVTARTIEETIVKDGLYTIDEICTPAFESACQRAGLIG